MGIVEERAAEQRTTRLSLVSSLSKELVLAIDRLEKADFSTDAVLLRLKIDLMRVTIEHSFSTQKLTIENRRSRRFRKDIVTTSTYDMWPVSAQIVGLPSETSRGYRRYQLLVTYICPTLQVFVHRSRYSVVEHSFRLSRNSLGYRYSFDESYEDTVLTEVPLAAGLADASVSTAELYEVLKNLHDFF